ncbi:uncharacterized protein LOC131882107 [Tigriopus californicus]|uniref:uncharacterized protein LOC131882107 n=1 Tax=Tigriopus californicus TaxID=6832 RepID=UPI0027DA5605|nr:uncharacterized protein LOC131882107 [Tigriopus californicus]
MAVMLKFLEETSIHGCKYLVHGRTILMKMIWLVSIVGCVTSSIYIIYLNIKNWQSSPAVVTSVEPILVKDQIPMPQITICPNDIDLNLLFFRLHKKYPELVTEGLMAAFQKSARILAFEQFYSRCTEFLLDNRSFKIQIFDPCKSNSGNITSECRFVHLLTAIVKVDGAKYLKQYITEQMETNLTINMKSLESYMEKATGKTMTEKRYPENAPGNEKYKVLKAYCNFFHVMDPTNPSAEVGLQRLEDYDIDKTLPPIQKEDFPPLYILLSERLAFDNDKKLHTKILAKALMESLRNFLGLQTIEEAVKLLDAYSYDYKERPFFQAYFSRARNGCEDVDLERPCSDPFKVQSCHDYCELLNRTSHLQSKVLELHHMGTYSSSFDPDWSPKALIPNCRFWLDGKFHEGPCFQDIVTANGRCLTTNPELMSSLKDLNQKDSFVMILFEGGVLNIHETVPHKTGASVTYKLYMTAPNHFTIDKFSEPETTALIMNRGDSVVQDLDLKVDVIQVVKTTPEFKAMKWQTRNCLYPEEKKLSFFNKYSESSCFLECAWSKAKDQCGCVPWFLLDHFPDSSVCMIHGNNCFRNLIELRYELLREDCEANCLADCDRYTYQYEKDRIARYSPRTVYPTESCSDHLEDVRNNMTCNFVDEFAKQFGSRVGNISERILTFNNQYYVRRMRITAKRRTALRILKTATVTFIDMLSNIGGTLGLFCGFSILSGVEILYWIIIIPYQRLSKTSSL